VLPAPGGAGVGNWSAVGKPFRLPSLGPEAWRDHVARPERHWRASHSAKELTYAWEAGDWPAPVRAALDGTGRELAGLDLLLGLPEHETPLDGHGAASQTDLLVIARTQGGELVVIGPEGKVRERFGDSRVGEWRRSPPPSAGRERRLAERASRSLTSHRGDSDRDCGYDREVRPRPQPRACTKRIQPPRPRRKSARLPKHRRALIAGFLSGWSAERRPIAAFRRRGAR
jgi:hypothetical protein